jgi:hypothetical protein
LFYFIILSKSKNSPQIPILTAQISDMKINLSLKLSLSMIIIALTCLNSSAQSTNTDTLAAGSVYLEANLWTGVQSHRNGGQQIYGGRIVYGLKNGVEIGVNGSGSNPLDTEYPLEIQPNIKWKLYQSKNEKVEVSVGAIAYIPFAKRRGTDTFVMTYANASKKAKYGTRFTAGVYTLLNRDKEFGSNKGVNLAIEKTLTKKANLSVQWTSGKNRFGYLTGGIGFQVGDKNSLFVGYSIGNYDFDNHSPIISFSRTF